MTQKFRRGLHRLALVFSLLAQATHAESGDWTFFKTLAVKLPSTWRILSEQNVDGIGAEILLGRAADDYVRLFVSGDKMTRSEFQRRMTEVINSKKRDSKTVLIGEPTILPFNKTGLRLDLRFESTIKQKPFNEIHAPIWIAGQGLDIFLVTPRSRYPEASAEFADFIKQISPYWAPLDHAPAQPQPPARNSKVAPQK